MTSIEWTDAVWNPVVGCSRVSAGCEHCYAERVAHRGMTASHRGLTVLGKKGPRWTGEVRFLPERLAEPLTWKKPRRVFVNSMSDLFHESVTNEQIAAVFGVMAASYRHTFQVLTKRPDRAREWFRWIDDGATPYPTRGPLPRRGTYRAPTLATESAWVAMHPHGGDAILNASHCDEWPLPNVWLGVSVEDQATADERIPILLDLPATVRWVSYEPALGPIDWRSVGGQDVLRFGSPPERGWVRGLDWIVVGGESGPGARPFDLVWARSTIEQCRAAGVPCFVKQLGTRPILRDRFDVSASLFHDLDASAWDEHHGGPTLRDRKGGDPREWPEDLRVRQWPTGQSPAQGSQESADCQGTGAGWTGLEPDRNTGKPSKTG